MALGGKRGHFDALFAFDVEGSPARHQHAQGRGRVEPATHRARGRKHRLEVVQHEQSIVQGGEAFEERGLDTLCAVDCWDGQRVRQGDHDILGASTRREVAEVHGASGEGLCTREREAGLAHAADAEEGDEGAGGFEAGEHLGQEFVPSYENATGFRDDGEDRGRRGQHGHERRCFEEACLMTRAIRRLCRNSARCRLNHLRGREGFGRGGEGACLDSEDDVMAHPRRRHALGGRRHGSPTTTSCPWRTTSWLTHDDVMPLEDDVMAHPRRRHALGGRRHGSPTTTSCPRRTTSSSIHDDAMPLEDDVMAHPRRRHALGGRRHGSPTTTSCPRRTTSWLTPDDVMPSEDDVMAHP
jgi:hypothetical protein